MDMLTDPNDELIDAPSITKAVLFVDVVASTAYVRRNGDQQWRSAVRSHERAARAVVERHHGSVESFTGDGFLILFDDPADAVECAVRLQFANDVQHLFEIRIGLEYGEVLPFGPGRYVGYAIHIASRITDLSGPGQITMSDRCYWSARCRAAIPPTEQREVELRGADAPVTVHVIQADHRA